MGSKVCDARYDSPVAANVFRPARFHVVGSFCLQEVMMKCKTVYLFVFLMVCWWRLLPWEAGRCFMTGCFVVLKRQREGECLGGKTEVL